MCYYMEKNEISFRIQNIPSTHTDLLHAKMKTMVKIKIKVFHINIITKTLFFFLFSCYGNLHVSAAQMVFTHTYKKKHFLFIWFCVLLHFLLFHRGKKKKVKMTIYLLAPGENLGPQAFQHYLIKLIYFLCGEKKNVVFSDDKLTFVMKTGSWVKAVKVV